MKKKKIKKKSLYGQILSLLGIAILVPLIIVSCIGYYSISKNMEFDFKEMTGDNVHRIIEVIKNLDKTSKESVEMLSRDPNVIAIMSNADSEMWLAKALDSFIKSHAGVSSAYLGTEDKRMILLPKQDVPEGFDPSKREWYKDAMAGNGDIILTSPYKNRINDKQYEVTFAKLVKDSTGKPVGVIGIDIKLDDLSKIVSEITIGKNGYSVLIDREGTIIAHKDVEKVGTTSKDDKVIQELLNIRENVFEKTIDGVKCLVFKEVEEDTGYTVLGIVPKTELSNKIYAPIKLNIIVSLIVLVLAIYAGNKFTKKNLIKPVKNILDIFEELSKGNFKVKAEKTKGITAEIEDIIDAVNNTIVEIAKIVENISGASDSLKENSEELLTAAEESSTAGDEVAMAVQQIADGSIRQSEKLNESSEIAEKLGRDVDESINDSINMMRDAVKVKETSDEGAKLMINLTQVFEETYVANIDVAEEVQALSEKSNRIGVITDAIKNITEQTNLLALNASIEAARAGETGRGFAVVAEEVRKLAEESAYSAAEIEKVVGEVKRSVNDVFEKLKHSTELNDKTAVNVSDTRESFNKIRQAIETLKSNIEKVSLSLNHIKLGKDSVLSNIEEVSLVAEESASTSQEVSASCEEQASGLQEIVSSSEKLSDLSEELKQLVSKFQI